MLDPIILYIISQGLKLNFEIQIPCESTIENKYSIKDFKTISKKWKNFMKKFTSLYNIEKGDYFSLLFVRPE